MLFNNSKATRQLAQSASGRNSILPQLSDTLPANYASYWDSQAHRSRPVDVLHERVQDVASCCTAAGPHYEGGLSTSSCNATYLSKSIFPRTPVGSRMLRDGDQLGTRGVLGHILEMTNNAKLCSCWAHLLMSIAACR